MILEKAAATPLPELLKERLFDPYQLEPIILSQEDNTPENQAHIYGDGLMFGAGDEDNTFRPRAAHESIGFGSSGIFTTAETLARWGRRLFDGEILQPASLQAMMEMVTFSPVANMRAYGLGVQEFDRQFSAGQRAVGHGGGNIGTSSYLVHFPDSDITFAVMINAFPNRGLEAITRKLIRVTLRDLGVIGPLPYIDPARLKTPAILFAISLCTFLAIHWWKHTKAKSKHLEGKEQTLPDRG
jgi:D-alanyl-D-alanine carboxypeptidase